MKLNKRQKETLVDVVWYVVVISLCIVMIIPFIWTFVSSIKPNNEIFSKALNFYSENFTLEHYKNVFEQMPVFKYAMNSLIIAAGLVFTNLLFGSLAGYSFAKLYFKGKRVLFYILMSSMMLPGIVTMIPNFLIIKGLPLVGGNNIFGSGGTGLLNSHLAIILPGAVGAYAVFMMKQFYEGLPNEIGEAAKIDGCSEFAIFLKIYLPLTKPALATLGFMTFISGWNAYLGPLMYINDQNLYTLQQGMAVFKSVAGVDYGSVFAGSMITMLPILILFLFAQKYYVDGIAFSGGK